MRRAFFAIIILAMAANCFGEQAVSIGPSTAQKAEWDAPKGRAATIVIAASDTLDANGADIVCDGIWDSNTINNACASLTNGGKVLLLDGTYHAHTTQIRPLSNTLLEGMGRSTRLVADSDTNYDLVSPLSVNNVRIANLFIDGNNLTTVNVGGIAPYDCNNFTIENCWLENLLPTNTGVYYHAAISINSSRCGIVRNNFITNCTGGIDTGDNSHTVCRNFLIQGNQISYMPYATAMRFEMLNDSIVSNNICTGGCSKIQLISSNNNQIINNTISEVNDNGIYLTGNNLAPTANNLIKGNYLFNCGRETDNTDSGIYLYRNPTGAGQVCYNRIEGNRIRNDTAGNGLKYGIQLNSNINVYDNQIINNDCNNSGKTDDIVIGSAALRTLVYGNITSAGKADIPVVKTSAFTAISGVVYSNSGDTDALDVTLPLAVVGLYDTFLDVVNTAAADINLIPIGGNAFILPDGTVMDANERLIMDSDKDNWVKTFCPRTGYWMIDCGALPTQESP